MRPLTGEIPDQLRAVFERELGCLDPPGHVPGHGIDAAAADFGHDIEAPGHALAPNDSWGRHDLDGGHVTQTHV
jgi:hypothetical protein